MADRQLPVKKTDRSVLRLQFGLWLLITIMTAIIAMIGAIGVDAYMMGHYVLAATAGIGMLLVLWSSGSLYVTVPLSAYFLGKYYRDSDYGAIDIVHTRALKLLEKLPVRRRIDIAVTMSNLALVRLSQGFVESAESLFSQALDYCSKNKRFANSLTALVLNHNMSVVCIKQKKYVEAELFAEHAMDIANSPKISKQYRIFAGAPLSALARIRYHLGEYDAAYEKYQEAIELLNTQKPPSIISSQSFEQSRAFCYLGMAALCMKQGKQAESEKWCDLLLKMTATDPKVLSTLGMSGLNDLANQYMDARLFELSEKLLDIAYAVAHDHPFHPDSKQVLNYYEKLLLLTGRQAEVDDMRAWLRHSLPPLIASN